MAHYRRRSSGVQAIQYTGDMEEVKQWQDKLGITAGDTDIQYGLTLNDYLVYEETDWIHPSDNLNIYSETQFNKLFKLN